MIVRTFKDCDLDWAGLKIDSLNMFKLDLVGLKAHSKWAAKFGILFIISQVIRVRDDSDSSGTVLGSASYFFQILFSNIKITWNFTKMHFERISRHAGRSRRIFNKIKVVIDIQNWHLLNKLHLFGSFFIFSKQTWQNK